MGIVAARISPPYRASALAASPASSPSPLPDADAIGEVVRRGLGSAGSITVRGPVRTGRYSNVFRVAVDGLATELAVKALIDPESGGPDAATALRQYDALRRVHDAMAGNDGLRVPRPFFVAPAEGVVAVEWIAGASMTETLLSRATSVDDAHALMRRAAAWLGCFARAGRVETVPLDVRNKLDAIASLDAALGGFPPARQAFAALRAHASDAGNVALETSWLHGDFKADNLLVDRDNTVGIDLHIRHRNAIVHDAAAFLNHWDLTVCDPRAWRWRKWRKELARSFLHTLDSSYLGDKRVAFAWIALHVMLGNWNEFTRRRRNSAKHLYLQFCFRSIVRRMTRELREAAQRKEAAA